MGDTVSRAGKFSAVVAVTLALISIILAPTVITDKEYWRPYTFAFMSLCCIHLILGSDYARCFIATYLTIFGSIRVSLFAFALAMGGPASRNAVPLFGATLGLVAAGILAFSKPVREFLGVRYEARTRRHTVLLRAAWILFLVYSGVILYLDLTRGG